MSDIANKYNERELNAFASKEWPKVLNFLKNRFGIEEDDCKDIFQESFIILYTNIQSGKLQELTASLSTYFTSICKNKALEFLRGSSRSVNVDSEMSLTSTNAVQNKVITAALETKNGVISIDSETLVIS